jgi:hypothetical protein
MTMSNNRPMLLVDFDDCISGGWSLRPDFLAWASVTREKYRIVLLSDRPEFVELDADFIPGMRLEVETWAQANGSTLSLSDFEFRYEQDFGSVRIGSRVVEFQKDWTTWPVHPAILADVMAWKKDNREPMPNDHSRLELIQIVGEMSAVFAQHKLAQGSEAAASILASGLALSLTELPGDKRLEELIHSVTFLLNTVSMTLSLDQLGRLRTLVALMKIARHRGE